jgi:hypothetical protein
MTSFTDRQMKSPWVYHSHLWAIFFMEDFEEGALSGAVYKPHSWFFYINDTLVIWPHGSERQKDLLEYLNSIHHNIQFTMETERDGHLPFLNICIYRGPDGSLGHMVYRKPIQTNLCLMQSHTIIQQTSNLFCPP